MASAEGTVKRRSLSKLVAVFLPVLFFSYMLGITFKFPLSDTDIWWHLSTGEYILTQGEIPDVDPFSYSTPHPLSEGQRTGLRSQWLGQVLYYVAYRLGGLAGAGTMRNLLILLSPALVFVWLLRRRVDVPSALAVTSFSVLVLAVKLFYSFERPQGFSFVLALVVVLLLERARQRSRGPGIDFSYLLLPVAMALWANIHGGYIIGNIIIIIYLTSELVQRVFRKIVRSGEASVGNIFLAVCLVSILASFANPNTYTVFWRYFTGMLNIFFTDLASPVRSAGESWVRDTVLEYKSLLFFYRQPGFGWILIYWAFIAFLYILLFVKYWLRKSFDLAEFLTVTFLALFANMYARGQMFSLAVMPLYLGKAMTEVKGQGLNRRLLSRGVVTIMLVLSVAFASYIYTYYRSAFLLTPGFTKTWITSWYPKRAVEFLKHNPIKPPMYNYYNWGGFLIWSLYPRYQVFIDTRAIDNELSHIADSILMAHPEWKSYINRYDVNFVVIPVVFRDTGVAVPLTMELANDDGWKLVFIGQNSAIFVRNSPWNSPIIGKYRIDRRQVYIEIVNMENIFLYNSPNNPTYNINKADALFALGRYGEAKAIYERFPSRSAPQLERLREMGY